MKHRILFRRIQAAVLSVAMLTSMCTTGFAAEVDSSPAESWETAVTNSLEQIEATPDAGGTDEEPVDFSEKDEVSAGKEDSLGTNSEEKGEAPAEEDSVDKGEDAADVSTDGEDTPAGDSTDGENTPAADSTDGEDTPTTDSTDGENTSAGDSTDGENTSADVSADGEDTPAGDSTDGEDIPAADSTDGENTSAGDSTDGEDTPAGDSTDGEDIPAADSTDRENTSAGDSTDGEDSPTADSGETEESTAAASTEGEDTTAADSTEGDETLATESTKADETLPADPTQEGETTATDSTEKNETMAADSAGAQGTTAADSTEKDETTAADPAGKEETTAANPGEKGDKPTADSAGKVETPVKKPSENNVNSGLQKPSAVKNPEDTGADEFETQYKEFLEKYEEDRRAEEEDDEPVNYRTWPEVRDAAAELLEMAKDLDDPELVQEHVAELKEIFINESAREYVRLTTKLIQSLAGIEDDWIDEEMEDVISSTCSDEFIRLVEQLIQDLEDEILNDRLESEYEEDLSDDDMTASVYSERGISLLADSGEELGEDIGEDIGLEEDRQSESLSDDRMSGYKEKVNRLLRDVAVTLYPGEEAMTGEELEEWLSESQSMSAATLGVEGMLESVLEEMRELGVMEFDEGEYEAFKTAVGIFVERLSGIAESLSEGNYSSVDELSADINSAYNKVVDSLPVSGLKPEEADNIDVFMNFFDGSDGSDLKNVLLGICALQKTEKVYYLADLKDSIQMQKDSLEYLQEEVLKVELLSECQEQISGMFSKCDSALDSILVSRKIREIQTMINIIQAEMDPPSYGNLQFLVEGVEGVNNFAESVLSEEDKGDDRFAEIQKSLEDINVRVNALKAMKAEFVSQYENAVKDLSDQEQSLSWEELSTQAESKLEDLAKFEAEYQIFTAEEYKDYEDKMVKILVAGALKEFKSQSESLSQSYNGMTPAALLKKIDDLKKLRSDYLGQISEEEKREVETLEQGFIEVKVSAFLAQVEKLENDVRNKKPEEKEYKDYYKFVAAMEDAKSLLDSEELESLSDEMKEKVNQACATLEELELEVSLSITEEARGLWETFKTKYEKLLSDYEENHLATPSSASDWKWEKILPRIEDIQKLASKLPTVYYNRTEGQRLKLAEILSEEAAKEVRRVIVELEDCQNKDEIRRKVSYARNVLDYVSGFSRQELEEQLDELLWKADLLGDELSDRVKKFLEAVRAYEKAINDPENLDEKGRLKEEALSVLTSDYKYVRELYQILTEEEKALEKVKTAYENLKELWERVCGYHNIKADLLNQIYDFLEAVEDFKKFYSDKERWKGNPLNLVLAYEECVEQCEKIKKDLEGQTDIPKEIINRFNEAEKYLTGLKGKIDKIQLGDNPTGGLYIAGDPIIGDVSVAQMTIDNTREFIRLVQNMEGGLNEIHAICQRIRELTFTVKNGVAATPSDATPEGSDDAVTQNPSLTEEDISNIQQEINGLLAEIDRVSKTTEYDNWYGLMGGEAYAQTAWSDKNDGSIQGNIHNPMEIKIDKAITAENLGLGDFKVDNRDALAKVEEAIKQISIRRSELGARQNLSERVLRGMENWLANDDSDSAHKVGEVNSDKEKRYNNIPENTVIRSSLGNARKLMGNIQTFEGILNESHDILQRLNELAVRLENDTTLNEDDRDSIKREMKALSEGLTFLAEYVNYDNWHGLSVEGEGINNLVVPTGWYYGNECPDHIINIPIMDMTEKGLGLTGNNYFDIDSINTAISRVSDNRSVLGAWQNVCEHIIELCEITLEVGPLIGNKFEDYTERGKDLIVEDGRLILKENTNKPKQHHRPVILTDWFDRIYSDMESRIRELERQKEANKDTYSDTDTGHIDLEIHELRAGVDILIDLIKTSVQVSPQVRLEENNDWGMETVIKENKTDYRYKLTYQSLASGTKNVCLVDHIEGGDNSAYAGTVTGVDISEAQKKNIPVKVYVQLSSSYRGEVKLPGELPEALKPAGDERNNWVLVDIKSFTDWKYVTHIAFDFGGYAFGVEEKTGGTGVSEVSVEIKMSSVYGGKPGCDENTEMPNDGYILKNTCDVYQKIGDNDKEVWTPSGLNTEVLIKYSKPIRLPSTGGGGTWPIHRAGLMFLAMGTCMLVFRRRDEDEPLF